MTGLAALGACPLRWMLEKRLGLRGRGRPLHAEEGPPRERYAGADFGTLVHNILQHWDFRADPAAAFEDAAKELRDRFGPLPEEALRLVDLFRIRRGMIACGIRRIARAGASRELVVEIFDPGLFSRKAPFARRDLRILGPRKAVALLPAGTEAPEAVLDHLKSRLPALGEA